MPSSGTSQSPCQTMGQRSLKIQARIRNARGATANPKIKRHPRMIIDALPHASCHACPPCPSDKRSSISFCSELYTVLTSPEG